MPNPLFRRTILLLGPLVRLKLLMKAPTNVKVELIIHLITAISISRLSVTVNMKPFWWKVCTAGDNEPVLELV